MNRLSLIIAVLALIVAGTTGGYAAWSEFSQVRIVSPYGDYYMTMATPAQPCPQIGFIGSVMAFNVGGLERDANGNCTFKTGFGWGSVMSNGDRGIEVGAANADTVLVLTSNKGPSRNIQFSNHSGNWVFWEDVCADDPATPAYDPAYPEGQSGPLCGRERFTLGQDGSIKFPNGCHIYPDAGDLRSSCHIRQPLVKE